MKNFLWSTTAIAVYMSAMFMCWATVLRQWDGTFWYGMSLMFFGVLWKLETKHWF